jgi:hypothetical protein
MTMIFLMYLKNYYVGYTYLIFIITILMIKNSKNDQ